MRALPALVVAILIACSVCWGELLPIQCRDPDVGGTTQNKDRKFMILGSQGAGGAGLGNILIFYPAAFYFAAVTGRDIIIQDGSIIGEMCTIINCGFPFVSQVALAFPDLINPLSLATVNDVKALDYQRYIEGSRPLKSNIVRAAGYQSKSDWWVWFNHTVHCVKRITGCDLGDVMCAERHAYQRLIRGPFKIGLSAEEEGRIHGVPDNLKHALLTLPHAYAPRLDAAVHLRAQFNHFESQANLDDPNYIKEVADFVNGTEAKQVFDVLEDRLVDIVKQAYAANSANDKAAQIEVKSALEAEAASSHPVYIYVASDNEVVKDRFCERLMSNPELNGKLRIMKVETKGVMHAKNIDRLKDHTKNEGLLDLVFDWYALSLANTILAWRKGGTSMVSTFVHSAQKVSGTTERTDNNKGTGMGTRGYQLIRTKSGGLRFDLFWVYDFLEDFLIKRR